MNLFFLHIKKKLIIGFFKKSGINFLGRKTIFTQGGGLKRKKRIIDYKRKINHNFVLLAIEKQLRNSAYIGLICYENGLFSYIITLDSYKIGQLLPGFLNFFKLGASTFLLNIPSGNLINNVEIKPGCGAQIARAAGESCFLLNKDSKYAFLKMNSGWLIKVPLSSVAIVGIVSNIHHNVKRIKNAGKKRSFGFRPRVRGVAMNPCDHAHGGGEGRSSPPVVHKTPYGKLTKVPTLRNKQHKINKYHFKIFS